MKNTLSAGFMLLCVLSACNSNSEKKTTETAESKPTEVKAVEPKKQVADLATILSKKEVPVSALPM